MYPFGVAASDATGALGDDINAVTLTWTGTPFKFLGVNYSAMYFSTNGWLCFTTSDSTFSSVAFPTYTNPVSFGVVKSVFCSSAGLERASALSREHRVSRYGGWTAS
jgi:hypothetical protein